MDTDAITRQPIARYERSHKSLDDAKKCIWACAMRLMEARDPDAPAHITMIGTRMNLPEREVQDAIRNAAKRTGWKLEATQKREPVSDNPGITPLG